MDSRFDPGGPKWILNYSYAFNPKFNIQNRFLQLFNSKSKIQNSNPASAEFAHRSFPILTDPLPLKHLLKGHPENFKIQPKRLILHIPHIQLEFVFPADSVAVVHLRPACYAWSQLVAACPLAPYTKIFSFIKNPILNSIAAMPRSWPAQQ